MCVSFLAYLCKKRPHPERHVSNDIVLPQQFETTNQLLKGTRPTYDKTRYLGLIDRCISNKYIRHKRDSMSTRKRDSSVFACNLDVNVSAK